MLPKPVNRKEIESHSSSKTNDLIFELKINLWKQGAVVMASTLNNGEAQKALLGYFSIVQMYYMEIAGIIDGEDDDRINENLKRGFTIANKLEMTGSVQMKEIYELRRISLLCHYMINLGMQKYKYFFRVGVAQPKGIDAALRLFGEDKKNAGHDEPIPSQA